jgi:hypothetical protein
MADDELYEGDEIQKLIDADPNAHQVEGEAQAWLLNGVAVNVVKPALDRRETD